MNVKSISKKIRNSNFFYAEIVLHLPNCYLSDKKHDECGILAFQKCQAYTNQRCQILELLLSQSSSNIDIIIAEIHRVVFIWKTTMFCRRTNTQRRRHTLSSKIQIRLLVVKG